MAIHNDHQIYDHIRMYNDECKWMIFCPNQLGQKNVYQCSSLNDLYCGMYIPFGEHRKVRDSLKKHTGNPRQNSVREIFSDSRKSFFRTEFCLGLYLSQTEFCLGLHTAVVFRMQSFNLLLVHPLKWIAVWATLFNTEIYAYFYFFWHIQYQTSKVYTWNTSNFVVFMQNLNILCIL